MDTEFSEQQQKELVFNHAFAPENFERYCNIVQNGIWLVYVNANRNTMPFITSDNPVLVEGIGKTEMGLFHNGLANSATCIYYPLNPAIAVGIYSRHSILGAVADKYDGLKVFLDDIKYTSSQNIKIIAQAYHHSFIPQPLFDKIVNEKI